MKNKEVSKLLGIAVVSSTLLSGCGYNPANDIPVEEYGPMVVYEETVDIEESSEETLEDVAEEEDLDIENEIMVPNVYGPARTPLERAINKVKSIFD